MGTASSIPSFPRSGTISHPKKGLERTKKETRSVQPFLLTDLAKPSVKKAAAALFTTGCGHRFHGRERFTVLRTSVEEQAGRAYVVGPFCSPGLSAIARTEAFRGSPSLISVRHRATLTVTHTSNPHATQTAYSKTVSELVQSRFRSFAHSLLSECSRGVYWVLRRLFDSSHTHRCYKTCCSTQNRINFLHEKPPCQRQRYKIVSKP